MLLRIFDKSDLIKLYKPHPESSGEDNGQVTIVGGSKLFHGAPLLSLTSASRIVDMVFFATPEKSVGMIAEKLKSKLLSFIWTPWEDVESYIEKSDAVLIGPGFMRFGSESTSEDDRDFSNHNEGKQSRGITERLLKKFPDKRWVIDAGSLQTMDESWIPNDSVLTPNVKEFELLFKMKNQISNIKDSNQKSKIVLEKAKEHNCILVLKGPETVVCSPEECVVVRGGNPGMSKGGTGDVLAGLTVALLAKNEPFLAASCASYIEKAAADELYKKVGTNYNADDLTNKIPETFYNLLNNKDLP